MNKKIKVVLAILLVGLCAFADITISPSSIDYAVGGGGAAVKTSGSGNWTAATDVNWITIIRASGAAGSSCTYTVSRNNNADTREGHITIAGNVYTVTQKGCPVDLSETSINLTRTGGSGQVTASMDVDVAWTADVSDSWISVTPLQGTGAAVLTYTVEPSELVGPRTGTIRIGSEKLTVTQTGVDVTLSLVTTNVTKDICIIPVQVYALAETTWTVTPNASWISVLDGGLGRGGSQITIAAAENPSFEKRTGTVSVGSAVLTIIQAGTDDLSFKILPENAEASPQGAFANVAVYATPDATWSAESMDSWIKITSDAEGAGNGNLKYVTMSNPELTERTGRIKFTPPVAVPELDLYAGLLFWIKEQDNIEGNELRQTTYPLSKSFDGSFANSLSGKSIPAKESDDYTLSFSFKVSELDCLNRLLQIGTHTLYLDEENVLHFQTLKTSLMVDELDVYYTIVIRMDENHKLSIYGGLRDTELSRVCEGVLDAGLSFITDVSLSNFIFGHGSYPSTGYLQSGRVANIRFWTRSLVDRECEVIDTKPHDFSDRVPSLREDEYTYFPLAGNLFAYNATNESAMIPNRDFNGLIENACINIGRSRIPNHALAMTANSVIEFDDLNQFFKQQYILYSGDLTWDNYDLY